MTAPPLGNIVKEFQLAQGDVKDYTASYAKELARVQDTIDSSFWVVPSSDADDAGAFNILLDPAVAPDYSADTPDPSYSASGAVLKTATEASIWLRGAGPAGTLYMVKNVVRTASGRTLSMEFLIRIAEKRPIK